MLEFDGPPAERGAQHGTVLADAIGVRIDLALTGAGAAAERAKLAAPWLTQLRAEVPDVLDELRGVAAGAHVKLPDLVLLNAFEAFDLSEQIESGGCTTVAFSGASGAIVGQNWDANVALAAGLDVHVHRNPRGSFVVLASPGSLGWIGMNDRGLALCNNDLLTRRTRAGLPSLAVRRRLLAAPDVRSAIRELRRTPAVAGRSYTMGDAAGGIALVEVAAELEGPALREGGPFAHANHAILPSVIGYEDAAERVQVYPSSPSRLARADLLIGDATTVEDAEAILRDHDGVPHSICRHDAADEPTTTVASVVFDCGKRRATFRIGRACTPDRTESVTL
jgi:isopenicillin-N N-acyltransferase-like protein